jgi:hypothetical protein
MKSFILWDIISCSSDSVHDVSKDCTASILKVEEQAKKARNRQKRQQ